MKTFLRAAAGAALLLPFAVAPASAQAWKWDFGLGAGYQWFTESVDEEHVGALVEDARFEPSYNVNGQLTFWLGRRVGLRANALWSTPDFGNTDIGDAPTNNNELIEENTLWNLSGDLLFRLLAPEEGRRFLPYIALGAGVAMLDPGDATTGVEVTLTGDGDIESGVAFVVGGQNFLLAKESQPMGLAALGADIRLGRSLGLRLEVGDRIWDSPTYRYDPIANRLTEGDEDVGDVIQQLYGTASLHFLFGVEEREVVAVAPPPPPPPVQQPPAPPAEEAVTVCVVDPSSPTGISVVTATYLPATRDTMVTVNGQRQRLARPTGLTLASEADWYVRGEPLTFNVGQQRMEYVTYGTSRLIEANDLAFIGVIRGVPVYANANDVADIRDELRTLRTMTDDRTFEQRLAARTTLREKLDALEVVYVPLQPTGCVFQGLQRVQEVRKVRGK